MREKKEAEMFIYHPAYAQALTHIWIALYLLNLTIWSELAKKND